MTAPVIHYEARLDPSNTDPDWAGSWYITHGLGKPAGGTYTEVGFTVNEPDDELELLLEDERVLEEVVRRVAADLYGTAWAFIYRPDQYADAIARYGMRRRERVIVTSIVVVQ